MTTHYITAPHGGTDLRICFRRYPGCPADLWGDAPHPAEPSTIELHDVKHKVGSKWVSVPTADDLWAWAEDYLAAHETEAFETVADDDIEAAEYRAECRRDAWR